MVLEFLTVENVRKKDAGGRKNVVDQLVLAPTGMATVYLIMLNVKSQTKSQNLKPELLMKIRASSRLVTNSKLKSQIEETGQKWRKGITLKSCTRERSKTARYLIAAVQNHSVSELVKTK